MQSIRKAIAYSSAGRYLRLVIGLATSIVTARMLSPEEIGTFAIASSVVMIMAEFRILGANAYIVRLPTVGVEEIRSAYGLTILVSWGMGAVLAAAAWPLGNFFDTEGLVGVFLLLSVSFIFAPYISIPDALMTRKYKFREITAINITSAIVQLAAVVLFIKMGLSFYSLALSQLCGVLIKCSLGLFFTREIKVYAPRLVGIKSIARLGIFVSVGHVIRKAQTTFPDMLIGKLGNPAQVGLFSRGLGFTVFSSSLVLSGILPVALPYLSSVNNKGQDVGSAYRHAMQLITGVSWPILAVASVASLPAIRLMFGDQWDQAAPVASVAAFWAMFRAAHVLAPNALIAVGKEGSMLTKEVIVFVAFLLVTTFGYIANGIIGVAYAFVCSGAIDFLISSWFVRSKIGLNFLTYCMAMARSVVLAVICWGAAKLLSFFVPFDQVPPFVIFLYMCALMPVVWLGSIFMIGHPLKKQIMIVFRHVLARN